MPPTQITFIDILNFTQIKVNVKLHSTLIKSIQYEGGMFDGIRVQDRDIMTIPSRRRNPIIADMFSRLDYMERRGSGFRKIINDYQAQYRYTEELHPIFRSEYDAFFLTLKNINYLHDHHNVKENCERNGKENVKQIVNLILNNPTITLKASFSRTTYQR